jgi:hypothetical protein
VLSRDVAEALDGLLVVAETEPGQAGQVAILPKPAPRIVSIGAPAFGGIPAEWVHVMPEELGPATCAATVSRHRKRDQFRAIAESGGLPPFFDVVVSRLRNAALPAQGTSTLPHGIDAGARFGRGSVLDGFEESGPFFGCGERAIARLATERIGRLVGRRRGRRRLRRRGAAQQQKAQGCSRPWHSPNLAESRSAVTGAKCAGSCVLGQL